LRSPAYVLGSLPDLFSIPTSGDTKKATDGNLLLDSVAAPMDLGVFFSGLMGIVPYKKSKPNGSAQAEAEG
jgi:hypothetical protein